jgi:tetratricopeptide (TPR) repeat protein
VVFAKLRAPRPRPSSAPPPRGGATWLLWAGIAALLLLGAVVLRGSRQPAAAPVSPAPAARVAVAEAAEPSLPASDPIPPPPPPEAPSAAPGLSPADYRALDELAMRMRTAPSSVGPQDLATVEAIFAQHPDMDGVRPFLEGTLVRLALTLRAQGRRAEAEADLRRAAALSPVSLPPRMALLDLLLEGRDWTGAEAVAREILTLSPRDPQALERLAFALFRQDRNGEAADVLRESLGIRGSPEARALLARIEKERADESGMTEQRLSHFNVRYDGEAHEAVGREVLRALERHYATLVATLDHEPRATIPVILFSRQAYYDASGAPAWSGGVYDNLDGRIRVPIGGLDASLGPEMDGTLIHELTHAFAAEITGSLTPSDVNEGLAQYMEGKRLASMLRDNELQALAEGRIPGVAGTYLDALSFVEYLMALRGQGGVNDLLRAMGETHSVDQAFQQVYGGSAPQIRQAWRTRLRQQHGG